MKYLIQPRILLEKVAGQYLLIAYGEKRPELPYIQAINDTAAFYWNLLEHHFTRDEIIAASVDEFDITADVAASGLDSFLHQLEKLGYLKAVY